MKKFSALVMALLALGAVAFSQSPDSTRPIKIMKEPKFIFTLHSGYAVALGSTFQFYPDNITNIVANSPAGGTPSEQVTYKAQTRGLGEGFRYGAGLSYVLNDFINVGIDFDYVRSSISRTRDSSMQSTQPMSNGVTMTNNFNEANTIAYSTQLLTISPNITFKAISRPKFFIYNKIGGILVLRPNAIQHQTVNDQWVTQWQGYSKDSSSTTASRYDWGIHGPALGFMGAIGAQVKLLERVRAFAEVQFTHVLYVIKNRVLTSYDVNGQQMVNTLSESEREVIFQKTLTTNTLSENSNAPTYTVTQRFPLTYVGLQVGLAYRF
jgi:hypothetical protein